MGEGIGSETPGAWERHVTSALGLLRLSSFKSKITALALIATLLPSLTMGWMFYLHNRRSIEDKIERELASITAQTARDIDLGLRESLYEVRVFSSSVVVTEATERLLSKSSAGAAQERTRLENYLRSVGAKVSDYEQLIVADTEGRVLSTSTGRVDSIELPAGWVESARANKPILGNASHDDALGKDVVTIGEPIRAADDRLLGILVAKLRFDGIREALRLEEGAVAEELLLIDGEGRVLVGIPPRGFLEPAVAPEVASSLLTSHGTTLPYQDSGGRAVVGGVQRLQQVEWGVLAQLDRSHAYAQVTRLRNITIGLSASLMIVVGLAAYLVGLTVVSPLERLVKGSARVAGGDLAVVLPVLGEGEVATLTAGFNEMVRGLSRGRRELDTTNETLREKNAELQTLSSIDSLTGLHNRRSLMVRLSDEVERARTQGRPLALLMIDVDHFKRYNDAHGHLAGDLVLRTVADVLKSELRVDDDAARYGGEEFVVLLPHTDLERASHVAERLRRHAEEATRVTGDDTATVTLSVGLSLFPDHAGGPEALLREADTALYEAKRAGRNRVVAASVGAVAAS